MTLMTLDGNSLAYRAFFALPTDMATASGQVTNAVFGFASMLSNLLKEHRPDGIVVVFDRPEPTFRHLAVPEYKAQREAAPDILRQQLGVIRELLDALGVHTIDMSGFEGDDLIATIARRGKEAGNDVLIVTGDRDSYQLVNDPHVRVLYNKRGVSDYAIYDEAGILERTGVHPNRYVEYAALRGDPSDNLEGTPGVGEKTAAKLVNSHASLEDIFDNASKQTPKLRASLEESRDRVLRNASIMVLRDDLDITLSETEVIPTPNIDQLDRLLDFLEMRTMKKRLLEAFSPWITTKSSAGETTKALQTSEGDSALSSASTVVSKAILSDSFTALSQENLMGISAVWRDLKKHSDLIGIVVATGSMSWQYDNSSLAQLTNQLHSCVEKGASIIAYDAKPLLRALLERDIDLQAITFDVAIAGYLIDPVEGAHTLSGLLERYTQYALPQVSSVVDTGQLDFGGLDDSPDASVSVGESQACRVLFEPLRTALNESGMLSLYEDMEHPLIRVLAKMETLGIGVDVAALRNINNDLIGRASALSETLLAVVGRPINFNSPTQLQEVLYKDRQLTPGKKTKTGFSTDAATLEKLRGEWPEFINPLLEYREVEKLRGTYGQGLLDAVQKDERIHATFQQAVARTGRLSSENPNLHNIPVRSESGRIFRTAFVARAGCELMVADYNQIELRCIAHLANDPGLVQSFIDGIDIHNATAARVFSVDPKSVTHDQRSQAKMVSYGLAYGMEAYGLSQRLAIGVEEATGILNAYFDAFPAVRQYMDDTVVEARKNEGTVTLFGRRRPIPELRSDNFRVRQAGERQAMNAGIQGLAADIFKVALVRIDEALEKGNFESRLVLQVHDEVIVEAPSAEKEAVNELVLNIMCHATELKVPLEVNSAWGRTWSEAK
jgi:DNA polymerase-1